MSRMKWSFVLTMIAAVAIALPALAADKAESGKACCNSGAAPAKAAAATAKTDNEIIAEQKDSYPLDTCVVMGNKLGEDGEIIDHVYQGRLVRFCCKGCVSTFEKDPQKYLTKIDEAAKAKAAAPKTDAKAPAAQK